jgi:hypothetical protein
MKEGYEGIAVAAWMLVIAGIVIALIQGAVLNRPRPGCARGSDGARRCRFRH